MAVWRILGAIGRTLITLGVLILLFVAYQLWGTGIQEARAQDSLQNEFEELLAQAAEFEAAAELDITQVTSPTSGNDTNVDTSVADTGSGATESAPTDEAGDETTEDSAGDTAAESAIPASLKQASIPPEFLYRDDGEVVGRILIDAINVDKQIVEGTGVEPLRLGPGRYPTTVFPGQPGNAAIAGHRTTYGAPFHRIDELVPGDEIKVQTIQGVHTYVVDAYTNANGEEVGHFIVDPSATEVLGDFGDNRLTLTACHPKYSAAKRIIVTAHLVSEPVDFIPRDGDAGDIDEVQLQGDENSDVEDGAELTGEERAVEQIISDEVAVDDDPSVTFDEDGNVVPVEDGNVVPVEDGAGAAGAEAGDDAGADTAGTDTSAESVAAGITEVDDREATGVDIDESEATGTPGEATDPSEATGDDDFGEGLDGDSAAILPSITWAIAAAFIWLAAWFIGTKWRKWPMYVIGLTPFALTLWLSFVHIDQALPSY